LLSPALVERLLEFRDARDWKQFHTARNLASALSVEAAELLEHFIWEIDSGAVHVVDLHRDAIEAEIADLVILLTYLTHDLVLDIESAVAAKLVANEQKYPVHMSRGSNKKYTELTGDQSRPIT
jgi:NTP pyrophosphatase (non-canonical NTP hydrolase)